MNRFTLALAAALALTACDDEGGGAKTQTIEDPATVQAGQATGQQSVALTQVQPAGGAEGAQVQFNQVGGALQAFVGQHRSFKAQAQAQGGLAVAELAQTAENSFSYTDGHLVASVNYSDGTTSVVYNVDLQIDGNGIDGTFALDLQTSQQMFEVDYTINAVYDGFKLDGVGCPIEGVITVDYDITVGGAFLDSLPPEARAQAAAGVAAAGRVVASYGPTCGEVSVEGT
jgi:hypothetical protein